MQLATNMKEKTAGGQQLFDVWMKQESDTIQDLSKAYGERMCMEQIIQLINKNTDASFK